MNTPTKDRRTAFSVWLRTGRWPRAEVAQSVEVKFNPWHDPRNGQFTFAPGGPRQAGKAARVNLDRAFTTYSATNNTKPESDAAGATAENTHISRTIELTATSSHQFIGKGGPSRGGGGRGSNIRAFYDPMTIQQIFPGIWNKPGGAIIAVADNFFNLLGPGQQVTTELAGRWLNTYISQIKSLDPNYQFQDSGLATTFEGQIYQLNFLRMKRAETYLRIKGDPRPLQVETLRFMQERADRAYNQGMRLLQAGKLPRQLSSQEALGNYVDREVREALRERYNVLGINWNGKGPVRVNSREYDNSGTDRTYRIPDVRIYDLVIDTSLTAKGPATPQVKGFFATDFRPTLVIILRPSQLGRGHTYAIPRMENKR